MGAPARHKLIARFAEVLFLDLPLFSQEAEQRLLRATRQRFQPGRQLSRFASRRADEQADHVGIFRKKYRPRKRKMMSGDQPAKKGGSCPMPPMACSSCSIDQ
jgi:hypothetical protein